MPDTLEALFVAQTSCEESCLVQTGLEEEKILRVSTKHLSVLRTLPKDFKNVPNTHPRPSSITSTIR